MNFSACVFDAIHTDAGPLSGTRPDAAGARLRRTHFLRTHLNERGHGNVLTPFSRVARASLRKRSEQKCHDTHLAEKPTRMGVGQSVAHSSLELQKPGDPLWCCSRLRCCRLRGVRWHASTTAFAPRCRRFLTWLSWSPLGTPALGRPCWRCYYQRPARVTSSSRNTPSQFPAKTCHTFCFSRPGQRSLPGL